MVRAGARRRTARLLTFAQVEGNLQVDLSERETGRDPIRINHSGCRGKTGQQARETARRLLSKCVYVHTHTHTHTRHLDSACQIICQPVCPLPFHRQIFFKADL